MKTDNNDGSSSVENIAISSFDELRLTPAESSIQLKYMHEPIGDAQPIQSTLKIYFPMSDGN